MTDHMHNEHNEEVRFERQDLGSKAVFGSLFALALFAISVYFVVLGIYKFMNWYEETHQEARHPMAQPIDEDIRSMNPVATRARIDKNFSQPRLETNERIENNDFRLQEEQKLHSYGWVDQQGGAVRIPIDRAMELIAQRGLNTAPRAGITPESVVNTISAAADRADHSAGNSTPQASGSNKVSKSSRKNRK
jgi:hypothetical protein